MTLFTESMTMEEDQQRFDAALAAMGARFDPEILADTRALYRSAVAATDWTTRSAISDLAYGVHPRHRLDLFPTDRSNAPILLFVHGGGFVGGDKAGDPLFYGNVGRYFASHGYLAVTMNYRLAPDALWPAGAEDVAAAIDWLRVHGRSHGGDPDRLVVLGQSAGASHVASMLFDARFQKPAPIRAVALMSGFYLAHEPLTGGPRLYFGDEADRWEQMSPAAHVTKSGPPLLISVAEYDPAPIAEQSLLLAQALTRVRGAAPRLHWLERNNHVSPVHGLGMGKDEPGKLLRAFFDAAV